jgi:hypothetical protein
LFIFLFVAGSIRLAYGYEQKTTLPDTLTLPQLHLIDSMENGFALRQCCNGTLAACMAKKSPCSLATRLHAFVKWLVQRGTSPSTISQELERRYASVTATGAVAIDTTVFPIAGDKRAPILICGYVSATCPICHFVTHELYDAVTTGTLKGKARLMVKPLGVGFSNRSLAAANSMGRFWDFFIGVAKTKGRVTDETLYHVADSLGMSVGEFKKRISAPPAESCVAASTAEAGANAVTLAPCYFIDRVRYQSYKDPMWLIDAVELKYETVATAK